MSLTDIDRRLAELRREQLRTKNKQQKLIIKGDIQFLHEQRRRIAAGRTQLGVSS